MGWACSARGAAARPAGGGAQRAPTGQNDPSDQGLCANFVRYSPYGLWTLTVPDPEGQGIDIAAVTALRFEFQITFQPPKDQTTLFPFFGKAYEAPGANQFGCLCRPCSGPNGDKLAIAGHQGGGRKANLREVILK